MAKKTNTPLVSVIIPTKNSENTITQCLKSIKKQSYKNVEIVIIDNHSTDKTVEDSKKFTKSVFTKGPERNIQRNFGVKKSNGKYIVWLDSDMQLQPKVIEECVSICEGNKNIKSLVIPEESIGEGFWAKCKILEKKCYLGDEKIEAVRFAEKKTFVEVGGFSEKFISGEDWDITARLKNKGIRIARAKSFILHNEGRLSLANDLSKKYYYATKSLPYLERHIKKPSDILLFIFRPAFFRNWKLLLSNPLITLGMLLMKAMEFAAGFVGIIVVQYKRG